MSGLILFDCDGVLVDSEVIVCRVSSVCLTEAGFPVTVEDVMANIGMNGMKFFADLEAKYGRTVPEDVRMTLRERMNAAMNAELQAIPGIAEVIDGLDVAKCVASSSRPERIRHSLRTTGLLHRLEPHIFSASQVQNGKPAPDLFLFAANEMGAAPENCLVVEDSVPGVRAGIAAGMKVIGFTGAGHCPPNHADRLREHGAHIVLESMTDLPASIGKIAPWIER